MARSTQPHPAAGLSPPSPASLAAVVVASTKADKMGKDLASHTDKAKLTLRSMALLPHDALAGAPSEVHALLSSLALHMGHIMTVLAAPKYDSVAVLPSFPLLLRIAAAPFRTARALAPVVSHSPSAASTACARAFDVAGVTALEMIEAALVSRPASRAAHMSSASAPLLLSFAAQVLDGVVEIAHDGLASLLGFLGALARMLPPQAIGDYLDVLLPPLFHLEAALSTIAPHSSLPEFRARIADVYALLFDSCPHALCAAFVEASASKDKLVATAASSYVLLHWRDVCCVTELQPAQLFAHTLASAAPDFGSIPIPVIDLGGPYVHAVLSAVLDSPDNDPLLAALLPHLSPFVAPHATVWMAERLANSATPHPKRLLKIYVRLMETGGPTLALDLAATVYPLMSSSPLWSGQSLAMARAVKTTLRLTPSVFYGPFAAALSAGSGVAAHAPTVALLKYLLSLEDLFGPLGPLTYLPADVLASALELTPLAFGTHALLHYAGIWVAARRAAKDSGASFQRLVAHVGMWEAAIACVLAAATPSPGTLWIHPIPTRVLIVQLWYHTRKLARTPLGPVWSSIALAWLGEAVAALGDSVLTPADAALWSALSEATHAAHPPLGHILPRLDAHLSGILRLFKVIMIHLQPPELDELLGPLWTLLNSASYDAVQNALFLLLFALRHKDYGPSANARLQSLFDPAATPEPGNRVAALERFVVVWNHRHFLARKEGVITKRREYSHIPFQPTRVGSLDMSVRSQWEASSSAHAVYTPAATVAFEATDVFNGERGARARLASAALASEATHAAHPPLGHVLPRLDAHLSGILRLFKVIMIHLQPPELDELLGPLWTLLNSASYDAVQNALFLLLFALRHKDYGPSANARLQSLFDPAATPEPGNRVAALERFVVVWNHRHFLARKEGVITKRREYSHIPFQPTRVGSLDMSVRSQWEASSSAHAVYTPAATVAFEATDVFNGERGARARLASAALASSRSPSAANRAPPPPPPTPPTGLTNSAHGRRGGANGAADDSPSSLDLTNLLSRPLATSDDLPQWLQDMQAELLAMERMHANSTTAEIYAEDEFSSRASSRIRDETRARIARQRTRLASGSIAVHVSKYHQKLAAIDQMYYADLEAKRKHKRSAAHGAGGEANEEKGTTFGDDSIVLGGPRPLDDSWDSDDEFEASDDSRTSTESLHRLRRLRLPHSQLYHIVHTESGVEQVAIRQGYGLSPGSAGGGGYGGIDGCGSGGGRRRVSSAIGSASPGVGVEGPAGAAPSSVTVVGLDGLNPAFLHAEPEAFEFPRAFGQLISWVVSSMHDDDRAVATLAVAVVTDCVAQNAPLFLHYIFESIFDAVDEPMAQEAHLSTLATIRASLVEITPEFAYHTFNYLLGLCLWYKAQARDVDVISAMVLPLMARLIPHIPGFSLRALRRERGEFLLSTLPSVYATSARERDRAAARKRKRDMLASRGAAQIRKSTPPGTVAAAFLAVPSRHDTQRDHDVLVQARILASRSVWRPPLWFETAALDVAKLTFMHALLEALSFEVLYFEEILSRPFAHTHLLRVAASPAGSGLASSRGGGPRSGSLSPLVSSRAGPNGRPGVEVPQRTGPASWLDVAKEPPPPPPPPGVQLVERMGLDAVACVHGTKLRVWLRLVRQLLELMPCDSRRLGPLMSCVTRLMQMRSDDESVVRLALDVFVCAVPRFTLFFRKSDGYALVLPPLLALYARVGFHQVIRSLIEDAWLLLLSYAPRTFVLHALAALGTPSAAGQSEATVLLELLVSGMPLALGATAEAGQPAHSRDHVASRENLVRLVVSVVALDPFSSRTLAYLGILHRLLPQLVETATFAGAMWSAPFEALFTALDAAFSKPRALVGLPLANGVALLEVVARFARLGGSFSSAHARMVRRVMGTMLCASTPSALAEAGEGRGGSRGGGRPQDEGEPLESQRSSSSEAASASVGLEWFNERLVERALAAGDASPQLGAMLDAVALAVVDFVQGMAQWPGSGVLLAGLRTLLQRYPHRLSLNVSAHVVTPLFPLTLAAHTAASVRDALMLLVVALLEASDFDVLPPLVSALAKLVPTLASTGYKTSSRVWAKLGRTLGKARRKARIPEPSSGGLPLPIVLRVLVPVALYYGSGEHATAHAPHRHWPQLLRLLLPTLHEPDTPGFCVAVLALRSMLLRGSPYVVSTWPAAAVAINRARELRGLVRFALSAPALRRLDAALANGPASSAELRSEWLTLCSRLASFERHVLGYDLDSEPAPSFSASTAAFQVPAIAITTATPVKTARAAFEARAMRRNKSADEPLAGFAYGKGQPAYCYHGPLMYEAKIRDVKLSAERVPMYLVHYRGWNEAWDEWVNEGRLRPYIYDVHLDVVAARTQASRDYKAQQDKLKADAAKVDAKSKASKAARMTKIVLKSSFSAPSSKSRKRKASASASDSASKRAKPSTSANASAVEKARAELEMDLPELLVQFLLSDAEFVTKEKKLVSLPRTPTVSSVLRSFLDALGVTGLDPRIAIIDGLRSLFNLALPLRLLYRFERLQFIESVRDGANTPDAADVYGAEHLLRLIVRLPSIVDPMAYSPDERSLLASCLQDLVQFLEANPHVFLDVYETPTPAYLRMNGGP
ncbi:uncharacterized protein AMSG_11961 [Thecamonas trahens ATCC 50062]|uniref:Chromo domain-containing protein n=1 Tax=Thecamonas trahens ATCC 50062 TaxID=461836 RepID=A0A0L0DDH8_THETB|nr:hypothetical protein AMSG_11961 [Thecamonas trahens ATCC 50062]KNC50156.1 hypothetical protein AMSG_11961 [Thecamonas trahens ATCC 50062]|eukprot:XP_013757118.1 hypothetical protein AMSG_11961 [Thecamonas trahens ATCC 50062]